MASAGSGGRAAPRDEEANGEPDRSLQLMLRAIAEERSRTGLRHEISGLGEGRRRLERERAAGGSGPEGRRATGPRLGSRSSVVWRYWTGGRNYWEQKVRVVCLRYGRLSLSPPTGWSRWVFRCARRAAPRCRRAVGVGACTAGSGSASRRGSLPALQWAYLLTCDECDVCSGVC